MIIILKKDGQIVTDDGNPVEGVKLENAAAILADPKDGDTIVYDATAGMWVAGTGGGSFDPDITNPQDGDTLVYDASEEKWVNGSGGGSGGVLVVHASDQNVLDKTWNEINNAFISNGVVVSLYDGTTLNAVLAVYGEAGEYGVNTFDGSALTAFYADTPDDYPVIG